MAGDLNFALIMKDGMSGTANEASVSLQRLGKMMAQARAEDVRLTNQMGKMHSAALAENAKRDAAAMAQRNEELASFGSGMWRVGEAAVALGAALATATGALVLFAARASEARERAVTLFQAMGDGSEGSGERTLKMLDSLTDRLPQTRKELVGWTRELESMGITDLGELRTQLRATASAQALVGAEGAEAYTTLTRKIQAFIETGQGLKLPIKGLGSLAKVGLDVRDVAREMGLSAEVLGRQLKAGTANAADFGNALQTALIHKGAAPLTNLNLELSTVLKKGMESFEKLFDSIDFRPLSDSLHFLFSLMDDSDEHTGSLKEGITGAIQSIVTGLGKAVTQGEIFFLKLEIWAIQNKASLKDMWASAGSLAGAFWVVLKDIGVALEYISKAAIATGAAIGYVADKTGTLGTGPFGDKTMNQARAVPLTSQQWEAKHAPAHASGGLVMPPAPGEAFTSVAPGEFIVPKGGFSASNDNGGGAPQSSGGGVHIEHLAVHIDAPQGVTGAAELTAHGLARALEQYQLAVGR